MYSPMNFSMYLTTRLAHRGGKPPRNASHESEPHTVSNAASSFGLQGASTVYLPRLRLRDGLLDRGPPAILNLYEIGTAPDLDAVVHATTERRVCAGRPPSEHFLIHMKAWRSRVPP